jgi:hypothetical protein
MRSRKVAPVVVWFKVDDTFPEHPKTWDLPDCAVALWTRAGAWSARNLTDGEIPPEMVPRWCEDPERAVEELVRRGLWSAESVDTPVDGLRPVYTFHDWRDHNPTREQVTEKRAARTRTQQKWRQKKAGDQGEGRQPVDDLPSGGVDGLQPDVDDLPSYPRRYPPDPTRPDPRGGGSGYVDELTESRPAPRRQPAPSGAGGTAPVPSGKQPPPVNQLCRRCGGNHPTEECPTGRHEPVSEDRKADIAKSGAEEVRAAIRETMNGRALGAAPEPGHWRDPQAVAAAQVAEARQRRGEPGKLPEAERESGPGGELPDEMPF